MDRVRLSQQPSEEQHRFSSSNLDLHELNDRLLISQPLGTATRRRHIALVDTPAKGVIAHQPQHQLVSQTPTPDLFESVGRRSDGERPPLGDTSGNAQQQNHQYAGQEVVLVGSELTTLCFNGTAAYSPAWEPLPEPLVSHTNIPGPSPVPAAARSFSTQNTQSLQRHRPRPLRHQRNVAGSEKLQRSLESAVSAGLGVDINPIYEWPQFLEYRRKQSEKGPDDRMGQKWPIERELAFIDALLIIAPIGRRKYQMSSQQYGGNGGSTEQYGRNMLISEYLWICCFLQHLPPGIPEPLREWKVDSDENGEPYLGKNGKPKPKAEHHPEYSPRKMVSSHLQVLKGFFKTHPSLYVLFPTQEKIRDGDEPEGIQLENLKADPVLLALREKRMPEERPNYAYWAWVLAADQRVHLRPSQCWICVSARTVDYVPDEAHCGGYAYNTVTGEHLDQAQFPHLAKNLRRDEWPRAAASITGPLLHEYTQAIKQELGGSAQAMRREWSHDFPFLHEPLDEALREKVNDIFHCHVVLNMHSGELPVGAELNSWVEITIQQPRLYKHDWKVRTLLSRPPELCQEPVDGAAADPPLTDVWNWSGHVIGCKLADTGGCDCASRRERPEIDVNPPAHELAIMLKELSRYPAHAFTALVDDGKKGVVRGSAEWLKQEKESDKKNKKKSRRSGSSSSGGGKRAEDGGEEDAAAATDENSKDIESKYRKYLPDGPGKSTPTQAALARRVGMMQELWSQEPPQDGPGGGGEPHPWVRRGVILWTFATAHQVKEEAGRLVVMKQDGATTWRFLTPIDPYSVEHRSRAIISGGQAAARTAAAAAAAASAAAAAESGGMTPVEDSASAVHRSQLMSPDPGFQQHLGASMSEDIAATTIWSGGDASAGLAVTASQHQHQQQQQQQQQQQHGSTYEHHSYHQQQQRQQRSQHQRLSRHAAPSYYGSVLGDMNGGCGLVTPPPTATMPSSYGHDGSGAGGNMAPSLSFFPVTSGVDSVDSVVDPFLSSSLHSYDVVAPATWEAHELPELAPTSASGQWSVHGSGVFGAGGVAASHQSPWDLHPQLHNHSSQQQQRHHQGHPGVWGIPTAVSTPTSSVTLDLAAGGEFGTQPDHKTDMAAAPAAQLQRQQQQQQQSHVAWTTQAVSVASSLASSPRLTPGSSHRGNGLGDDGGRCGGGSSIGANRFGRSLKRTRTDDDCDAQSMYRASGSRLSYARSEGYASVADAKYAEDPQGQPPAWPKHQYKK